MKASSLLDTHPLSNEPLPHYLGVDLSRYKSQRAPQARCMASLVENKRTPQSRLGAAQGVGFNKLITCLRLCAICHSMLIGFLGAPCSGKTTTAALVFAALKNMGKLVEFIPESARLYICQKREQEGNNITLSDWDQTEICNLQDYYETLFIKSGTDTVLTDSSVFNSFLYMTPEFRNNPVLEKFQNYKYDYLFHCPPIPFQNKDPNRIHDYSTSLEIEKSIPKIIHHPYITLQGDAVTRSNTVIRIVTGGNC